MAKALAFCEEFKRNISLEESHDLFFKQAESSRHRFVFRCGDQVCRAELNPLVVAALYHRLDAFDPKSKSPYFAEHASHPHVKSCTWISGEGVKRKSNLGEESDSRRTTSTILNSLGLILKIKSHKKTAVETSAANANHHASTNERDTRSTKERNKSDRQRPVTSRFMLCVATNFLQLTDLTRRSTPLEIEGISKGTFYDTCIPIVGFHPHFQPKKIYRGKIFIVELTNVFLLKFHSKISETGAKLERTTLAEIKVTKKWLEENDRSLRETLNEIVETDAIAWCFFYTTIPIEMKNGVARFQIDDPNLIAVIPEWQVNVIDEAKALA